MADSIGPTAETAAALVAVSSAGWLIYISDRLPPRRRAIHEHGLLKILNLDNTIGDKALSV